MRGCFVFLRDIGYTGEAKPSNHSVYLHHLTIMNRLNVLISIGCFILLQPIHAQDAKELVRKADARYNGERSSYSEMSMTIIRPTYQRTLAFKSWVTREGDALTLITAPAREKGQSFLKTGNNIWNWNPTIQRLIKLPPSMLSQGWMGSDFSNDDVLKESSLVKDYRHKLLNQENLSEGLCHVVELTPLENAAVVWGKIRLWITVQDELIIKSEFYDEDELLVKTHIASNRKQFDGRLLPSVMDILPADEPDHKTRITVQTIRFNEEFPASFFTQQNMKRIK